MAKKSVFVKSGALFIFTAALSLVFCGPIINSASAAPDLDLGGSSLFLGNVPYLPLTRICRENHISYRWDDLTGKIFLYRGNRYVTCLIGETLIDVNGSIQSLGAPPRILEGTLVLPREVIDLEWWKDIRQTYPPTMWKDFTIRSVMIDAGHGGRDSGGIGFTGIREKDIVLDVAKRLQDKLNSNGIDARLTRSDDTFVPLSDRAAITNNSEVDLFISIHANIARTRWVSGFEIYYCSDPLDDSARAVQMIENAAAGGAKPASGFSSCSLKDATLVDLMNTEHRREAIELARSISASLGEERLVRNHGIRSANFHVLKWIQRPSILIEVGFLTNPREAVKLRDSYYQDRLAERIAEGILSFKREYERTEGFTK